MDCNLLFVDDEIRIVRSLSLIFRRQYNLFSATSGQEALKLITQHPIHVLISDQRMPGMSGVELLRRVKELSPNTMRILLTGYSDVSAVVQSINEGEIFRYITKPWVNQDVRSTVASAAKIAEELFDNQTKPPAEPTPEMMLPYHANIMVLDGNIPLARTVQRILGAQFTVHVAENFQHVVELMDSHEIGLILADLRDLRSYNVTMLKILKKNYPLAVSIVLTDQVDAKLGIQLINQGQIFRFITNDHRDELRETLVEGLRYYQHIRKNPAVINRHSVEPAADIETVRLQTQLIDRLPNIRRKMAALLASSG